MYKIDDTQKLGSLILSWIGIHIFDRRLSPIGELEQMRKEFPLTVTGPCRNSFKFRTVDGIPLNDYPCICGNKSHWVVKYDA